MSERKLVGTVAVDSGQIAIVDPSHIELALERGDLLIISTQFGVRCHGLKESLNPVYGRFPVYFEKDDEGGYGKSRIIIELEG